MQLTRREKHVLVILAILLVAFMIIRPSYETVQEWEWLFLFVVVGPIGFYIASDPERRKVK